MFDIASSELLLVAIVALLVVGPKDLPKLMRAVGQWIRRGRALTSQIRSGFEQMMQEAEFQEQRERIMREHPDPEPAPRTPGEAAQVFSAADSAVSAPAAATTTATPTAPSPTEPSPTEPSTDDDREEAAGAAATVPVDAAEARVTEDAPRAASEQRL
ncbi:Sec-independent protein translocase protein TatB [Pedomonas mirosovicensis]|uniref:Sec-independent protein translocase protein TatB n=1 Tax=Pedomonas mirosovicensis TaxID=2908641 RepID=UPI00216A4A55|nr:Sec-independent protein translocase protein TatB [Pedomonas mirosovicensis]MCH8685554.1 Sec-independent protein translocase protein TatB [Pedomonas mirosovicensis]